MKIDRRCFLSLGIGVTAGTALSPLPWKITDDLSIWSQMWPWTPVPARGEASYATSTCTLCKGGCGISVRKVGERVVKIEGLSEHPVNDGGICLLGLSGPQLLYGPQRIKRPLKRVGERGQGRWQVDGLKILGLLKQCLSIGLNVIDQPPRLIRLVRVLALGLALEALERRAVVR